MKSLLSFVLLMLVLGSLAGCSQDKAADSAAPATPPAGANSSAPASGTTSTAPPVAGAVVAAGAPKGSIKVGDMAVCVVCAAKEGKAPAAEHVKAVLDYKDKTYAFCNEEEKAEFISNPVKYAGQ